MDKKDENIEMTGPSSAVSTSEKLPHPRIPPERTGIEIFNQVLKMFNDVNENHNDPRKFYMCTLKTCCYHSIGGNNASRHYTFAHTTCSEIVDGRKCAHIYENVNDVSNHQKRLIQGS